MTRTPHPRTSPAWPRLTALAALVLLPGCALAGRGGPARQPLERLQIEVVELLDVAEPSPAYYRERARLEVMGSELDEVLIRLVENPDVDENIRANALTLLADRGAPGVVRLARRMLLSSAEDQVRAAAVTGLQRFAADSPQAKNALRAAVGDVSRGVRLVAVQGLDVEDAPLLRALLREEADAQVRLISRQLLTVFESRGAPLLEDERGDLRTSGADTVPRLVFHPVTRDREGTSVGAVWVEMPNSTLVPVAQEVEVVANVVPAFFDPPREHVVVETGRTIQVRQLRSGATRSVGPGIAPRVIPFTDRFVYLLEDPARREESPNGTVLEYRVMRASFTAGEPDEIGRMRALLRADRQRGASPARWMVVGELRQGWVLRGPGLSPFLLPGSADGPPLPPGS